ncbi:macro domain-containing protein [Rhodocytophaga aerolata]|uniref:Macro domain-containing protein n=1 Tax=Rhodocytophaga aerolata TaxID=455078 RepID=A0ABT8RI37_9BACT|nr:macro domain-containing protein [Rhodocytophaga aerolata]MDO1451771.1 macro domain-containing protein [Rhodocytophaga aerolata]
MLHQLIRYIKRLQIETLKPFGKQATTPLKLSICEQNKEIALHLAEFFKGEPGVEILCGNILYLAAHAIVSPANSFGDMGGGLDKAIDDFYGGEAQARVQKEIREKYWGELPVGTAAILEMHTPKFPFLIVAPTMRIPGNVSRTINAYLAMRAILVAVLKYNLDRGNKIIHIALSSLCTGVGGMPYVEAAEQMLVAYKTIIHEEWRATVHPSIAPYVLGPKWIRTEKK